tara:strand:- start:1863 stop:2063 length:201 start_codon:yes stop_codon:yes gene_type:complete
MKVGDLVVSDGARGLMEGIGIVMEPPRLSADCFPGGDAENETYRIVKVLWPAGIDEVFEEDIEVVS